MKLLDNILITFSARVALLFISLVSSVILARYLGPEGRGLFALVLLLPELMATFALLGIEHSNVVYAGLTPEGRRALVWHSLAIAVVIGGVLAGSAILYFRLEGPGSHVLVRGPLWLYLLALSTVPGKLLTEYWGAILRGMNRIALLSVVEVGNKVTSLSLVIFFLVWLQSGIAGAVWANVVVDIGLVILMLVLLQHVGVWGKPEFNRELWSRTARFGLTAYGGLIAAYLNYRIDQFFIAAMLPSQELGFYVIAVGLAERLWIFAASVGNALLPHLTNTPERNPLLPALIARHVMFWTGAMCLILFLAADVLVRVLFSEAFADAVAPLRWLLPGIFVLSAGKILNGELLAREKPKYALVATVTATVANILGNLALIPLMGISGSALASSISYSLLSIMLIRYFLRETSLPWTVLLPTIDDLRAYAPLLRRLLGGGLSPGATARISKQ